MAWDLRTQTRPPQADDDNSANHDDDFAIPEPAMENQWLARVLTHLLKGGATIRDLRISLGADLQAQVQNLLDVIEQGKVSAVDSPRGLAVWKSFMPNLRNLELNHVSSIDDVDADSEATFQVVSRLLAEVTELRSLTIDPGFLWEDFIWDPSLTVLANNLLFPYLHTLIVVGQGSIPPQILLRFLDRHSSNLRHLHFEHACLASFRCKKTWPDIFDHLRNSLPALESVNLHYLQDYYAWHRQADGPNTDCAYRRRHLDIACRWILGNDEATDEEREDFEDVRANWSNWAAMERSLTNARA